MDESELLTEGYLDADGYPTQKALDKITNWEWQDSQGWFAFVKSLWYIPDWGWREAEEPHEFREERLVYRYYISTGGWSGNESLIRAMQENEFMWNLDWVQSRRGGHYIFERYNPKDMER